MTNEQKTFISNISDESCEVAIEYAFGDSCPLTESQLDVYMDEELNDVGTGYNNPFKIKMDEKYSVEDIKQAIGKLSGIFPVLSARVVVDGESVSLAFDSDFPVIVGCDDDANSFVRPFDLEKNLSKFLIVETDNYNFLYIDLHQLIFDYTSLNIILDNLDAILNDDVDDFVDDGVLKQISLENFVMDSEYRNNVEIFYESILSDQEEVYELLPSTEDKSNSDFKHLSSFYINSDSLNSFLQNHSIDHNQFFTSAFAYTLSRFTVLQKSCSIYFTMREVK